ncbi:MAG: cytochrome c [Epsilonproteobacteria bacterium]|nr:cytochrome c [Campylobacterota bacterium]
MKKIYIIMAIVPIFLSGGDLNITKEGDRLFREYCWGCHHQTSMAFGPSFKEIANKRDKGLIIAQIVDPEHTYKKLGYKRNSMPAFKDLNATELEILADFILSFKDKKEK